MSDETLNLLSQDALVSNNRELRCPDDVVHDPVLSTGEKRALLAAWASDLRAVPDAPPLRFVDNGAVVRLASILDALKRLDQLDGKTTAIPKNHPGQRRGEILNKWRRSPAWRRGKRRNDDDEPPPVPSAVLASSLGPAWI